MLGGGTGPATGTFATTCTPGPENIARMLPDDWDERRDLGLVRAELGDDIGAVQDLAAYVEHSPGAEDVRAITDRIDELRAAGRPQLH